MRSFLLSSAIFWLDHYHVDGLRVDAVASMLYLDYSRKPGEWIPNVYGGRENLEAIAFLQRLNEEVYREYPDVQTFAEESTAWPMVSRPLYVGGLGFGFKWDMGWMHDTLALPGATTPFTASSTTTSSPSGPCTPSARTSCCRSPTTRWCTGRDRSSTRCRARTTPRFANLRLLYAWQYAQPGKKLLFMGGEFGQGREWNHEREPGLAPARGGPAPGRACAGCAT